MNWKLLHRYLTEECDPEDIQKVEAWMHADKSNLRFMNSLKKIWDVEPADEMDVDARKAWNSFKDKLDVPKDIDFKNTDFTPIHNIDKSKTYPKRKDRTIALAVMAAAVILIAFLFYNFGSSITTSEKTNVVQAQVQEIETKRGQRTTFRLLDGTKIQLNADSKIVVSSEFGDSNRTVHLDGEAYFEVAHDPSLPFIVKSDEAITRVLGTKFGVRAHSDEDEVQVVVTEGKVELGSTKEDTPESRKKIFPKNIGTLSKSGITKVSSVENIESYLGWRNGKLVFDDIPLSRVENSLERWFDIEIILEDSSLADRHIKASFENESMTEVFTVIALSLDIRFERDQRVVKFKK